MQIPGVYVIWNVFVLIDALLFIFVFLTVFLFIWMDVTYWWYTNCEKNTTKLETWSLLRETRIFLILLFFVVIVNGAVLLCTKFSHHPKYTNDSRKPNFRLGFVRKRTAMNTSLTRHKKVSCILDRSNTLLAALIVVRLW